MDSYTGTHLAIMLYTPDDIDDDRVEYALEKYSLQKSVFKTNQNSIA